MATIIDMLVIFAFGIVGEILVTLYYIAIGKLQVLPASITTILITFLNFFIIEKAVVNLDWSLISIYAIGTAVGCSSIIIIQKIKLKKKLGKKKEEKFLFNF